jgi:hypothetical protein
MSKSCVWNHNRQRVLVSILLSVLHDVCIIASRGHSEDATSNRCEENHDHSIVHRMGTNRSRRFVKRLKMESIILHTFLFPDLKNENLNFRYVMSQEPFGVHPNLLMRHNGQKVVSRSEKHHLSQLPHPLSSPEISPGDLGLSVRLKEFGRTASWIGMIKLKGWLHWRGIISFSLRPERVSQLDEASCMGH